MANPTMIVPKTVRHYDDTRFKWYFVGGATNTKTYVNGQMVGTPVMGASKAGLVTDFDDSQALTFLGVLEMPSAFTVISSTTADSTIQAFIQNPYRINMPLSTGTASRATDIGKPVYAVDAGHVTLNGALTTFKNICGYVVDIDSGAGMPAALTGPNVWFSPSKLTGLLTAPTLKTVPIPLNQLREKDMSINLPNTATATTLALICGTYLTDAPLVKSEDAKTVTVNPTARFTYVVPSSYVAASAISVIAKVQMVTTVADTSAFLLVNCVREAAPTVDLGPVHQSMNSLTPATLTFALTTTNVVPGDILDFLLTTQIVDGASGTAVIAQIDSLSLQLTY